MNPSLWRVLGCEASISASQTVGGIALAWWIVTQGGARDIALSAGAIAAVALVATPLGSPLVDRLSKSAILRVGLLLQALSTALLATLAANAHYELIFVLLLRCAVTFCTSITGPALTTLIPEIVKRENLAEAYSRQQSAQSAGRIAGLVVGGVLTTVAIEMALLVQVFLLLFSAFLFASSAAPKGEATTLLGWWNDLREGVRASWFVPTERGWIVVNFLAWLFLYPAMSLLIPLKVAALGLSSIWLGTWELAIATGTMLGALKLASLVIRKLGRYNARLVAALTQGTMLAAVGYFNEPLSIAASFFILGASNATLMLAGMTHRMLARPGAYRARMTACVSTITQLAGVAGATISALVLVVMTVNEVYMLFALLTFVSSVSVVLVPGFKLLMSIDQADVEGWYERTFPRAFRR